METHKTSSHKNKSSTTFTWKNALKAVVPQLLIPLLVIFAFRSSVYEPFKIPSGSMIPTLYVGDFIFVNKFAYGLKVPFLDDWFKMNKWILKENGQPQRGDIIVFRFPENPSIHFIKRLIGLPGDKIEIRNKVVYINDRPQAQKEWAQEEVLKELKQIDTATYSEESIKIYTETVDAREHTMMIDTLNEYNLNHSLKTVPEAHYFVMGDNRDFSNDSRNWGYVPWENIVGRAEVIWFSLALNYSEFKETKFHPERIGQKLR